MTTIGNFGYDTRNDRGDRFVGFAERINLKIINILFYYKQARSGNGKPRSVKLLMKLTSYILANSTQ